MSIEGTKLLKESSSNTNVGRNLKLHVIIRCILFIGGELTTWPANNCLQISVLLEIIFCSCVVETTLLRENNWSVPRAGREWFDIFSWSKERWSNDKTIIERGYRKISWFVSVSQFNHLPGNNWSARHLQITIFCSASSNNCYPIFGGHSISEQTAKPGSAGTPLKEINRI